jgi:glycerol-1-phosphate dehydrogenase [NAD(P)+]
VTRSADTFLDPTDLDTLRRVLAADVRGARRQPIGMTTIDIGTDTLDLLGKRVAALRRPGPVIVLTDATPMRRGAVDLKSDVVRRLSSAFDVRHVVLGADRTELHADERALTEANEAVRGAGCVVTVGSGTITDIGKEATHRVAGIPLVVVQTAVSVNAFSDDMAVLLRDGVKRTVPSRWPDALIVDLQVIADAPPEMTRAGYGELMAMFTAPADWYLATAIGMDDTFDPGVVDLFRDGGPALLEAAPLIARGDRDALGTLARLMTLSGIAMGVAGRTAPLSGTEHLISHLIDMAAEHAGTPLAFHGAQVGAAATVVARIWASVLASFDPSPLLTDRSVPDDEHMERRVRSAFLSLDPSGRVADECWRDYRRKLERWRVADDAVAGFARDWPRHRAALSRLVAPPGVIADALATAGAVDSFADLRPPVSTDVVRWAVLDGHLMRDRFTVADLCHLAGAWEATALAALEAPATAQGSDR